MLVLLPLEVVSGYLEKLTDAIVKSILAPYRQEIPIAQNTTGNVTSNITEVSYETNFQDPPDILKVCLNRCSNKVKPHSKFISVFPALHWSGIARSFTQHVKGGTFGNSSVTVCLVGGKLPAWSLNSCRIQNGCQHF